WKHVWTGDGGCSAEPEAVLLRCRIDYQHQCYDDQRLSVELSEKLLGMVNSPGSAATIRTRWRGRDRGRIGERVDSLQRERAERSPAILGRPGSHASR